MKKIISLKYEEILKICLNKVSIQTHFLLESALLVFTKALHKNCKYCLSRKKIENLPIKTGIEILGRKNSNNILV